LNAETSTTEEPSRQSREAEARSSDPLRVLFCIGVGQNYSDAAPPIREAVLNALTDAFSDLKDRFGVGVLGTLDDDRLRIMPSQGWPWTAYILADVPNLATVTTLCNLIRQTRVEDAALSKYVCMEARVGRRLFFANE
jgi:hypothetical protein